MATDPDTPRQYRLDFNPAELTPEEKARFQRYADKWTIEEEMEDFKKLPFETLAEFMNEREIHLRQLEAFGPEFKREPKPSEAWQIVNGQVRAPPSPRQMVLKFE